MNNLSNFQELLKKKKKKKELPRVFEEVGSELLGTSGSQSPRGNLAQQRAPHTSASPGSLLSTTRLPTLLASRCSLHLEYPFPSSLPVDLLPVPQSPTQMLPPL